MRPCILKDEVFECSHRLHSGLPPGLARESEDSSVAKPRRGANPFAPRDEHPETTALECSN